MEKKAKYGTFSDPEWLNRATPGQIEYHKQTGLRHKIRDGEMTLAEAEKQGYDPAWLKEYEIDF